MTFKINEKEDTMLYIIIGLIGAMEAV